MAEIRLSFAVPAAAISRPATPMVLAESLFAGTMGRSRQELASAVERLGGSLGASYDGDRFVVGGSVLAANLPQMLDLYAEFLAEAAFAPAEVRADRDRVADETLISLTQPEVIASEALRRRLHGRHPSATGLPAPAALRRVSPAALRDLSSRVLSPVPAHLVVVGDLDAARTVRLVEERLGPWLSIAGSGEPVALPPLPEVRRGPVELVDRPGSVQSNLLTGLAAPARGDDWWPAASLANLVYGGLFTSRLVGNLRERNGYSYSPRSSIGHGRAGSTFVARADVGREVTAAALLEMRYEMARVAVSGIEDEELESARRYALGTLSFLTATQSGLAATLSSLAAVGIGPGYLTSHPAAIARATKAEVEEAARRLFGGPSGTVVVGDAEAVGASLAAVDEVALREPAAG
jgi:predicted Zn-dependent peptidase